jgi:hypothetical protein
VKDAILHSPHVIAVGEVLWGVVLIAVTMVIHAVSMPATLSAADQLWRRWPPGGGRFGGVSVLVVASWMIVLGHMIEVLVWSAFLFWRGAFAASADAFYFTLCQYVTVGSDLVLPDRWRLLGGMISMAGLLTFAWSTAVLLALAQRFEDAQAAARHSPQGAGAGAATPGERPPGRKGAGDD